MRAEAVEVHRPGFVDDVGFDVRVEDVVAAALDESVSSEPLPVFWYMPAGISHCVKFESAILILNGKLIENPLTDGKKCLYLPHSATDRHLIKS